MDQLDLDLFGADSIDEDEKHDSSDGSPDKMDPIPFVHHVFDPSIALFLGCWNGQCH